MRHTVKAPGPLSAKSCLRKWPGPAAVGQTDQCGTAANPGARNLDRLIAISQKLATLTQSLLAGLEKISRATGGSFRCQSQPR